MYETVLGRAPDAAGLNYWVNELALSESSNNTQGVNRWEMLADFAISPENQLNIDALSSSGGYLIIPTATGGYADSGVQFGISTVLSNASSTHFLNANLISTSNLPSTTTLSGITVAYASGTGSITDNNAGDVVVLSSTFPTVTLGSATTGNIVVGPSGGGAVINDSGAGNNSIRLSGTGNVVNYAPADTIAGYQNGDHLSSSTTVPVYYTPTAAAPLAGSTLNASAVNIVYIGAIGETATISLTTAAATAANLVYTPAGTAGETVLFVGQAGTDTAVLKFVNASTPTTTVTAAELTAEVTLIGITASTLTSSDFHS